VEKNVELVTRPSTGWEVSTLLVLASAFAAFCFWTYTMFTNRFIRKTIREISETIQQAKSERHGPEW
jgi:hypothetical protein